MCFRQAHHLDMCQDRQPCERPCFGGTKTVGEFVGQTYQNIPEYKRKKAKNSQDSELRLAQIGQVD